MFHYANTPDLASRDEVNSRSPFQKCNSAKRTFDLSGLRAKEAVMKKTVLRRSLFEKAARLLAGDVPPAWLISELEWLADGISADRWFEKKLPTRGELRNSLIAAKEATQLLIKLCESSVNIVFLDSEKLGKFSPENYDRLALLGKQLLAAVKALQADDGTTSRGANRVRLPP
jgi:hypothetical protein